SIFQVGGCFGAEFPINCVFDDEGTGGITQCVDFNQGPISCFNASGAQLVQPFILPGVQSQVLDNLDGEQASGVWKVEISDNSAGDDGHVKEVGLAITVNLPQIDPSDNCGEVEVTH